MDDAFATMEQNELRISSSNFVNLTAIRPASSLLINLLPLAEAPSGPLILRFLV